VAAAVADVPRHCLGEGGAMTACFALLGWEGGSRCAAVLVGPWRGVGRWQGVGSGSGWQRQQVCRCIVGALATLSGHEGLG